VKEAPRRLGVCIAEPLYTSIGTILLRPSSARGQFLTGQRLSISFRISSAHRTPSTIALTVTGTRVPPSYIASFQAAKMLAAINSTRFLPSSLPYITPSVIPFQMQASPPFIWDKSRMR